MDRSIALGYMGIGKEAEIAMHGRKPLPKACGNRIGSGRPRGGQRLTIMESYAGYAEMNIVGRLGAVAGMDDVRDKPDIMAQACDLGAKMRQALEK